MDFSIPSVLGDLKTRADAATIGHLDLIIDNTAFDYPLLQRLAELTPTPQYALLLEGTLEDELALEGPVLVRVAWAQAEHISWLGEFLRTSETQYRALLLLSAWPLEALTKHLRYFTQAHWRGGASSGILRYYDTRLFKHILGTFTGEQKDAFHAAAITWKWLNRDHREQQMDCRHRPFGGFTLPSAPLMLEDYQVDSIRKHTAAEQWEALHGLAKRTYWVGKEQEVFQIYLAHDEAKRKGLEGKAHTAFVFEWLAHYMPETLPKKEGLL